MQVATLWPKKGDLMKTTTRTNSTKQAAAAGKTPTATATDTVVAETAATATPAPADIGDILDASIHEQIRKITAGVSPIALSLAYADWAMHLAASPGRQYKLFTQAMTSATSLLTPTDLSAPNSDPDAIPKKPVDHDLRFSDDSWNQWPFNTIKNSFKAGESLLTDLAKVDGVNKHNAHLIDFFNRQTYDALSPSNWLLTNPEVHKKSLESQGLSLLAGWRSFTTDAMQLHAKHARTTPDEIAELDFKVGQDVATTKGKIVFRNHLIELIQYTPTTQKVYKEPILIVPSCIMKYYILDLSPENSMVGFLVNQGHTVFMISWKNPDETDRKLGIDDYLNAGVIDAMIAVKTAAKSDQIHALGYCLGGTFLAMAAAALANPDIKSARPDTLQAPSLASITLLAAQTDFSEPGELSVYIDADQIKNLRESMARTGYLTGKQMAASFQFLHARDLLWSKNTRRYLLGQSDVGNDMMSWNADVTRLPERMHAEYLQSLFLNNDLAHGHFRVNGKAIALMDIQAPLLVVGTTKDHVSPWHSVYKIHLLTNTATTFILASGGHNAGIISEPGHPKRSYQIASVEAGHRWIEPKVWSTTTPTQEGSWWTAMHQWLSTHSHGQIASKTIAPDPDLMDAPGEYVMKRYGD
jgi:polyhydroxyalkanoate synthase